MSESLKSTFLGLLRDGKVLHSIDKSKFLSESLSAKNLNTVALFYLSKPQQKR